MVRTKAETSEDELSLLHLLFVEMEPAVQITFLDAAGVKHEHGAMADDLPSPYADAAAVAVAATAVREQHGEDGLRYLRTLARYSATDWPGVAELVATLLASSFDRAQISPSPFAMSPRKQRPIRPSHMRPRKAYEDLSPEMEALRKLLVGSRADAFMAHRRMQDWLPETVADRWAQAVLALRDAGEIAGDVAAYLMMPFVTGVARARLASRPKFQLLKSQIDEEVVAQVTAPAASGEASRRTISSAEWRTMRVERRVEVDYLRELGEDAFATRLDEDDWHDPVDDGARALLGVALDGIRVAVVMPDGTTPTPRQFDRALYRHIDALDRGVTPPTFRQLLDDVAAEDGQNPARS